MNTKSIAFTGALAVSMLMSTGYADFVDRPRGFKIGERLTLRPYVSLSYTYDSNIDSSRKKEKDSSIWVVNPGIGAEYIDDNWQVTGRAWYRYHAYSRYSDRLNQSSYGENLAFKWTDSLPNERGWTVMFSENFSQIAQDDDMTASYGKGVGRDRKSFQASSVIERRINEYWHAAAEGSFYYLDYENNMSKYASLYGWKRTTLGAEAGYTASPWTDFIFMGSYQWYEQDNTPGNLSRFSDKSDGITAMAGVGTRATERISYRVLSGWSRFNYAGDTDQINGWTYQGSAKWKISSTWNTMLLATSYYQPSEREASSAIRVDSVAWGLSHSMVRGKLNSTFDISYRKESHEFTVNQNSYNDDIITARLALTYIINRFCQVYGSVEYQTDMCDGNSAIGNKYDYDRYRGTVGVRLTY